jgi:SH3-like domain-containing protein
MPRAQWIGLGLAAALAVALTAGLVFAILTITRPSTQPVVTPTSAPVVISPTPLPANVGDILRPPGSSPSPVAAAPSASAPPGQATTGQRLQITNTGGDGANLRRDPGQNGDKIKTIPEGTLVEIAGPDKTIDGTIWRNVRDLQGDSGWIAGGFLGPEGSAIVTAPAPGNSASSSGPSVASTPAVAAAPTAAPRPTSPGVAASGASRGQVGNTSGQGANIRSEPGSSGKVLKTLPEGSSLDVVGPDKEVDGQVWRQVRDSSGVTGWIIRGAVAPAGSVPTPAAGAAPRATSAPAAGPTSAPAAKPTSPASGAPAPTRAPAAPAATSAPAAPKPTSPPGNLPIIIQPATPRPSGGATPAPAATPKPTAQGAIPVATAKPSGGQP